MVMSKLFHYLVPICLMATNPTFAADPLKGLPAPVKAYAMQFEEDCRTNKLGHLVTNGNFEGHTDKSEDVNSDGKPDYFVYKCMFGCSEKPSALEGRGTPCPWGSLLLSEPDGYKAIFLPGMVTQVYPGKPLRVAITRPRTLRLLGNFCEDGFGDHDPQYVYELTGAKLLSQGMCPLGSCGTLLSQFGSSKAP
jgi:hypothetical protein